MSAKRQTVRLLLDLLSSVEELEDVRYLGPSHASRLTFRRSFPGGPPQYYGVHIFGLPSRPAGLFDLAIACPTCGAEHNWRDWARLALCGDGATDAELPETGEEPETRHCGCGTTLTVDLADRCWTATNRRRGESC